MEQKQYRIVNLWMLNKEKYDIANLPVTLAKKPSLLLDSLALSFTNAALLRINVFFYQQMVGWVKQKFHCFWPVHNSFKSIRPTDLAKLQPQPIISTMFCLYPILTLFAPIHNLISSSRSISPRAASSNLTFSTLASFMATWLWLWLYQESISVHPTRRQILSGKPYSTFPNIWELVIL